MPRFVARSSMPVSADALFAWHESPGALQRLLPPWQPVRVEQPGGIRDGDEVVLRLGPGPASLRWVARHRDYEAGRSFVDEQLKGPFARWVHSHRCLEEGEHSILEDEVEYALPGGELGARLGGRFARGTLERMFRFRHARTRSDLLRHARYREAPRLRVAATGATGLLGSALEAYLGGAGHELLRITRSPRPGTSDVGWDPPAGRLDAAALAGVDAVVNLAGEGIFSLRWSEQKKRAIRESRVRGTELLARTLASLERRPRCLVSASAVGYYGSRGDETLTEESAPGDGFLADVCRGWEQATAEAEKSGIRVAHLRIGVVLAAGGGALATMLPPFQLGIGGRIGSGEQWFSWISLDDLVGAIEFLLHGDVSGPVNATAPQAVTNAEFTRRLGAVLRRPSILPLPAAALRTLLGDVADEMLLASAQVRPSALTRAGFAFEHPQLEQALRLELGHLEGGDVAFEHDSGMRAAG